ncbi:hypothetical protein EMPS_07102 [Entomortierella parvispora]|uniref:Uncharacterized protein n=1 Tax=Entomortierella parvispora TaxID=205924 RepID=A0A9P3HDN0_9FUNG|nr:hypothetical protein EMPS_07102 [Entomortierella parvispora]
MDTPSADSTTTVALAHNLAPQDSVVSQSDTHDSLALGTNTLATSEGNAHHAQHLTIAGKLVSKMNVNDEFLSLSTPYSQPDPPTTKTLESMDHPSQDFQQEFETSIMSSPAIISCKMREPAGEKHEGANNNNISSSSSTTHSCTNPSFMANALPLPVPSSPAQEAIMLHPNINQHQGSLNSRSDNNNTENEGEGSDVHISSAASAGAEMNAKATTTTATTTTTTTTTTKTGTTEAVSSSLFTSTVASDYHNISREKEREGEGEAVKDLGGENKMDHRLHSSVPDDSNTTLPSLPFSASLTATTTTPMTGSKSPSSGRLEDAKEKDSVLRPSIIISTEPLATTTSSSSSSLSEYLLIGQEQVEKEDIESDLHSERSFNSSSQDSFGDFRNQQEANVHDRPLSSFSNYSMSSSSQSQDEYEYEDLLENPSLYRPDSPSQQDQPRQPKQSSRRRAQYSEEQPQEPANFKQRQQRITAKARPSSSSSQRDRDSKKPATSASASSTAEEKSRKRRSYRASVNNFDELEDYDEPNHQASHAYSSCSSSSSPLRTETASTPATSTPILPALKIPSVRGLTKSVFEFIIASVVCLSLISCMFAFSYVSTGATRLVGWYSDQRIGQRFRDGIKEREHFVQETLEKMAGEEYAKVKRQSRQYGQQPQSHHHHHQQQQQQHQSRYQQQYQQDRDQRYQQQQRQEQQERGRLSPAEWQELIRAASMSFMAKFSSAPESVPGFGRR